MINLDKNKKYLLACSFGPDSMALFDMLKKEKVNFSAALINYHLREESTDEMDSFIDYCNKEKISYHVKDLIHGVIGSNIESACRNIRYDFFADLVDKFKYDAVLVAHNEDDVIETYLMQKRRQNLPNYFGIKEETVIKGITIIRPLLNISKENLLKYCLDNNVPFAIDSSNLENKYLRNRIRHNVVSKLSPDERTAIINEINERNRNLEQIQNRLGKLDLNSVSTLMKLSFTERCYAINDLVKKVSLSACVSSRQIREISKVFESNQGNIDIPISRNLVIRKSYNSIEVLKPKLTKYSFALDNPGIIDNEYFYLNFIDYSANRNVSEKDYPLTIRNYRIGDKYQIKDYLVPVRRLFIDWKMPLSLRERWPLIINKEGKIIYIPRFQKDFKPDKNTNFYVK